MINKLTHPSGKAPASHWSNPVWASARKDMVGNAVDTVFEVGEVQIHVGAASGSGYLPS